MAEKFSRSGRSEENIDLVHAYVVEVPKMSQVELSEF